MNRLSTLMMITALFLAFQAARGAEPSDVPAVEVHYADLDLTRSAGIAALYGRLKSAAETACGYFAATRDLEIAARTRECVHTALMTAVAKVDRPALSAYYRAHSDPRNAPAQVANK